jgi:hypothetical protein
VATLVTIYRAFRIPGLMCPCSANLCHSVKISLSVSYKPLAIPLELQLLGGMDNRPVARLQIAWVTMLFACISPFRTAASSRLALGSGSWQNGRELPRKRIPLSHSGT